MNGDVNGDVDRILALLGQVLRTVRAEFTTIWFPVQIGLIVIAAAIGFGIVLLARRSKWIAVGEKWPFVARKLLVAVQANLGLIVFILIAAMFRSAMLALLPPTRSYVLGVSISLATAWVAISILAALIRNHFVNRVVAVSAWIIATLSILGELSDTTHWLDSVAVVIGSLRLSLLLLLKTAGFLLLTLWAAGVASNFIDRRVRASTDLTPSIQVLITKLIRLTLITVAIVVVLSSVGIDLSVLAIFSGAVGVGLGFGLQRIVSNLVSGIILLADKSIKPGDVITVGDTFGWVDTMGGRYTSVVVRDGREILIPNEDLVTQRVINWSHTNDRVRLDVDFGVSYASDPHAVRALAVATALTVPRIMKWPEPVCHLVKFNDFSLDFVLRFWIEDPIQGVTNVRGAVMLALWDAFKREGIEIPFPVRELRFGDGARVAMETPVAAAKQGAG